MSIASFSQLLVAINTWLDRDDLYGQGQSFIQLAEARMNRLLEDPNMEATVTLPLTLNAATLPADFGTLIGLDFDQQGSANSYDYSISGDQLQFAVPPPSSQAVLVYRRRIPALDDSNQTNWLLTLAPDAYLYGSLLAAEGFLGEDTRIEGWKSLFDEAIAELRMDGDRRRWGAGPLAPRIMRA